MEVLLRTISGAEEARTHLDLLQRGGLEALKDLDIEQAPADFAEKFIATHIDAPETLFLIAETSAGAADIGFILIGPHTDPLSGVRTPMVLILSIVTKLRHRGLAATLVQEGRRTMKRRGFPQLAARCPHGDDPLISMGERWGFVRNWEFLSKD